MGQRKSKEDVSSYDVASVNSARNAGVSRQSITIMDMEPQLVVPPAEESTQQVQGAAESPAIPQNVDLSLVPEWVNEQHFVDLVRKQVTGFKQISNFKAYPALGFGENYSTLMLRVAIDVELEDNTIQHKSYMLKVPHANEQTLAMMKVLNLFAPESEMYFDVIPELEAMYKEAGVDVRFGADAYKLDKEPDSFYVLLEDLGPQGFKNANRFACLDKEHTESVLRKLAQLHAASAYRVATKGPYSDVIMYGQFNEKTMTIFMTMFCSFQAAFLRHLKTYKDGEKYYENMEQYFKTVQNQYLSHNRYDPSEFNVLNHGDSWINNVLFKNDANGRVLETLFVDLQIPKFGSPVQDLQYFLMSSTHIGIKLKHFDYFIRYYYDHLIENLKLLKYPKKLPTLRELHMQLFKYGPWSVSASMIILPMVLLDATQMASLKNFATNDEAAAAFKDLMFTNDRYRAHIEEILPWLWNRGLLEPYKDTSETQTASATATETVTEAEQLNSVEVEKEEEDVETPAEVQATVLLVIEEDQT